MNASRRTSFAILILSLALAVLTSGVRAEDKKSGGSAARRAKEGITVDNAEKTYDGFTLYTTTEGAQARLIDMRGNMVHRWELPFRQAWPKAPHVEDPLPDALIPWFRCYLYPNGDLLAIYHAERDTPYGYGLVKLDKDSKLLWAYANNVHDDVDVGEDGTIYTLAQKLVKHPPDGLEFLPTPYLADSLVVLSPEGQERDTIPLVEAFAHSPYALTLSSTPDGAGDNLDAADPTKKGRTSTTDRKGDLLHANSVRVLPRAIAAKFPLFKAGQVLVSLRNRNTLAVLDRSTRRVIWAAQGLWRRQHAPEFLENGHLLLYDNLGSQKQTRILEYDPITQGIPWYYAGDKAIPFKASKHGAKQRLPNGNTLIVDPDHRRLFEVARDKEVVWENYCPPPVGGKGEPPQSHAITGARRYRADELAFLKGVVRPRP